MKEQAILCLALCVATGARAQSRDPASPPAPPVEEADHKPGVARRDPQAVEILQRAHQATLKVRLFTYTAEFSGEGRSLERLGIPAGARVTGAVTAAATEREGASKFRYDVRYTPADAKDTQQFSFGSDGDLFFFIDPETKTVYEDIDPVVFGPRARIGIRGLGMREFLSPAPFNDEINGKVVELEADRTIGHVPCHEVHVEYAQGNREAYWQFGKRDHLPRGVRRVLTNDRGEKSTVTLTITHLAVNPSFFVNPFKALVPEGWTRNTDDVAP